ncbi:MAG: hypothetical protein MAG794_00176 [Gammaproteobacteria bacterium]|nr:hypothetical protein [Gammaproteobacteria bacterium]
MIRALLLTPVLAMLLFAGIYLLTPQAALELPAPRIGYLDTHAHIAGIGAGGSGCFVNAALADSYKFKFYLRGFGVTRADLKEHGDELVARHMNRLIANSKYVRNAVILALDGVIRNNAIDRSITQIYVPNEFVSRMARKYRHLKFGASVHPDRSDWRERLVRAKGEGAVLVKWLPAIMDIDPSDPRHIPYYRTLVKLGLPLLVHVGTERAFSDANDTLGDPRKLTLPLKEGVTVIAAHIATTGKYEGQPSHERLLSMFQEFPNLYADISSLTQINKVGYLVEALKAPGVRERLLYGSDWPLQFFPLVSPFFHWPDIGLRQAKTIQKTKNPWDRDVALKTALGVPRSTFQRSARLLLQ